MTLEEKIVAFTFGLALDLVPPQPPDEVIAHFHKSLNHPKNNVFSMRKYLHFCNKREQLRNYRCLEQLFFEELELISFTYINLLACTTFPKLKIA